MQKTVTIPIEVDALGLVAELTDKLNYEEALDIIRVIDDRMADWKFTKQVAAFFMNEILKSWREMGEDGLFEIGQFIEVNSPKTV